MRRLVSMACAVAAVLAGMAVPLRAGAATLMLCGNSGTAPAVRHVILVMLENRSYKQVVGSSSAPYQTSLASSCGVATAMFGATHTSAANYLAMSAGQFPAASPPGCGSVSACADSGSSLYTQLDAAGKTWKAYEEAMPSACDTTSSGSYKIGHNPPIFYTKISSSECTSKDNGVSSLTATSGAFYNALQNNTLPSFSWITPSTANDGENTCGGTCALSIADTWLKNFIALVQPSPAYQAGNTLVLVTYDEGTGPDSTTGEDCTNKSLDLPVTNGVSAHQDSCHVPFFVIYPYTKAGTHDGTFFDHYSVTRTVEKVLGLAFLNHAADTQTVSLIGHFGIP